MRQKFIIIQDDSSKLRIREYAVIGRNLKNVNSEMLREDDYDFLCEETYDRATIQTSIAQGMGALIATLRTINLFPIEPYAAKIAESVMDMGRSGEAASVELFFNDVEWSGGTHTAE